MSDKKMTIYVVKTDKGCFITTEIETKSYNSISKGIEKLLFDGKSARKSFKDGWYYIDSMPNKIEEIIPDKNINRRYELKDKKLKSESFPLVIESLDYEDKLYPFYERKHDIEKGGKMAISPEIKLLVEIDNFEIPKKFEYVGFHKHGYSENEYTITAKSIEHQLIDKVAFPSIVLSERRCKLNSKEFYNIIRQHIKDNIALGVAKITSDYDFCFTVKKIIPLYAPVPFTYTNPFESTKRKRQKIHHAVHKVNETTIFEMTSKADMYEGYTVLKDIEAETENKLKKKIDLFLEDLMVKINKPLVPCSHCEGKGYIDEGDK